MRSWIKPLFPPFNLGGGKSTRYTRLDHTLQEMAQDHETLAVQYVSLPKARYDWGA